MKVFWLNGGLRIEPETDVETEALLVVMQAIHYDRPVETDTPQRPHSDQSGQVERGGDLSL